MALFIHVRSAMQGQLINVAHIVDIVPKGDSCSQIALTNGQLVAAQHDFDTVMSMVAACAVIAHEECVTHPAYTKPGQPVIRWFGDKVNDLT